MAFSVLSHISGSLDDPQKRSVGMLDLGGGSTQITFLPRTEVMWTCMLLGSAGAEISNCSDLFLLEIDQELVSVTWSHDTDRKTEVTWSHLPCYSQSQRYSQLFISPLTPVGGACGESARAALFWGKCSVRLRVLILGSQFVLLIMKNSKAVLLMSSSPTFGLYWVLRTQ